MAVTDRVKAMVLILYSKMKENGLLIKQFLHLVNSYWVALLLFLVSIFQRFEDLPKVKDEEEEKPKLKEFTNITTQTEDSILLQFLDNPAKPVQRKPTLQSTLKSMVGNKLLSDTIFCIEEEYIPAHTFLLATRSDVFATMFEYCKISGQVIAIPDISMNIFRQLLLYIYTDEIDISNNNVTEILYAAHKYDLAFLEERCLDYIDEHKTINNVLTTINTLYHINAFDSLKNKLFSYVCENFYDHFNQPDCFTKIESIELVKFLLEKLVALDHKPDNGRYEFDLFEMLIQWGKMKVKQQNLPYHPKNVRQCLDGAEEIINLDEMNAELLNKCVAANQGFFTKEEVCKFLMRDNNPSGITYTRNNLHNSIMHQQIDGCILIRTTPQNLLNRGIPAITDYTIEE